MVVDAVAQFAELFEVAVSDVLSSGVDSAVARLEDASVKSVIMSIDRDIIAEFMRILKDEGQL
jgi:hypothetical protein